MIDVVAAVNDERVLASNLLRSPMMSRADVRFHSRRGFSSAARAYSDAMADCHADLVVFVHQDVYLPGGWEQRLRAQVALLERDDPDWGVLGVYGVTPAGRHVGCVWSSGLGQLLGETFERPEPVASIDEVLIVVRRASGLSFDPKLPGYHLYATDLVQTAREARMGTYAICAPVVHNSRPLSCLDDAFFDAYRFVATKWRDRLPIPHNVAPLLPPGPRFLALRTRHKLIEWRHARRGDARPDRGLDCVRVARELAFE
jgi:hypothetical protein